jgi:cob(I)alamin adenosyltransferase
LSYHFSTKSIHHGNTKTVSVYSVNKATDSERLSVLQLTEITNNDSRALKRYKGREVNRLSHLLFISALVEYDRSALGCNAIMQSDGKLTDSLLT